MFGSDVLEDRHPRKHYRITMGTSLSMVVGKPDESELDDLMARPRVP